MKDNHKLGLYVSYYLAKYDKDGVNNLGYKTWNNAFQDISKKLNININSVKNWRDEFDPLFEHRSGWHQRPMSISRVRVAQALENLSELQVRDIAKDILAGDIYKNKEELEQLLNIVRTEDSNKEKGLFIVRNPTGRAAEEFFVNYFSETNKPIIGKLIDSRDFGVGYDFKIETNDDEYYIEVKGLSNSKGGILLTDKEWAMAHEKKENYFLCLISDIANNPKVTFIQNPAKLFNPKKHIYTSIQVSWVVSSTEIDLHID